MTRDTEQEVKPCRFVGGACVNCDATERGDCQGFVCNTHAPREWVGLTDEDYLNALDLHPHEGTDREFWNVLEAKLKEKNNG